MEYKRLPRYACVSYTPINAFTPVSVDIVVVALTFVIDGGSAHYCPLSLETQPAEVRKGSTVSVETGRQTRERRKIKGLKEKRFKT